MFILIFLVEIMKKRFGEDFLDLVENVFWQRLFSLGIGTTFSENLILSLPTFCYFLLWPEVNINLDRN